MLGDAPDRGTDDGARRRAADGADGSAELRTDGGSTTGGSLGQSFDPEELRRRNANAVAIDVLYLFTTAFFATLFVRNPWAAAIAAVPLATLVYFAWRSTTAFLVAQLLVIAATVVATYAGVLPL